MSGYTDTRFIGDCLSDYHDIKPLPWYCPDMKTPAARTWTVRDSSDLGRAISGVRRARGLTQAELAERMSLHRQYLAGLETGANTIILERSLRILRRLGATVTVTIDDG